MLSEQEVTKLSCYLATKISTAGSWRLVEASVHSKTATRKLKELLHQSSISCATLAVLKRLSAVMHVKNKGSFMFCICCCIPSKAMAKCKSTLQLWQAPQKLLRCRLCANSTNSKS